MKDLKTALWCDLTTDEERSAWLLLGRGYETGVVAKAIQNDLARAYQRLGAIMSGDHNQYRKPDRKCDRCGKANPAEIHTCTPRESCCAECGKKASEGWALYCVECSKPMREWVGLTGQDRNDIEDYCEIIIGKPAFYAIEAKLKEKNI